MVATAVAEAAELTNIATAVAAAVTAAITTCRLLCIVGVAQCRKVAVASQLCELVTVVALVDVELFAVHQQSQLASCPACRHAILGRRIKLDVSADLRHPAVVRGKSKAAGKCKPTEGKPSFHRPNGSTGGTGASDEYMETRSAFVRL